MEHLLEELFDVLFDGDIHLHLKRMRASIGVLRVGVVLRGAFREPSGLTLPIDPLEDRYEAHTLTLELLLESFQRRTCKPSGHDPLQCEQGR